MSQPEASIERSELVRKQQVEFQDWLRLLDLASRQFQELQLQKGSQQIGGKVVSLFGPAPGIDIKVTPSEGTFLRPKISAAGENYSPRAQHRVEENSPFFGSVIKGTVGIGRAQTGHYLNPVYTVLEIGAPTYVGGILSHPVLMTPTLEITDKLMPDVAIEIVDGYELPPDRHFIHRHDLR